MIEDLEICRGKTWSMEKQGTVRYPRILNE